MDKVKDPRIEAIEPIVSRIAKQYHTLDTPRVRAVEVREGSTGDDITWVTLVFPDDGFLKKNWEDYYTFKRALARALRQEEQIHWPIIQSVTHAKAEEVK